MKTLALVGIGDIAQKAWLPALNEYPGIRPVLVIRNPERRRQLSQHWRAPAYASLAEALASETIDWVSIHADSQAHASLAEEALKAGKHVLVDKPLAMDWPTCEHLIAQAGNQWLLTAFNRRLAPLYQTLSGTNARALALSKHRYDLPGPVNQFLYDDFIHVLDTLLWWGPAPETMTLTGQRNEQGLLTDLAVSWLQQGVSVSGHMSRHAGQTHEQAKVIGHNCHGEVHNLRFGEFWQDQQLKPLGFNDWASVAEQRGFLALLGLINEPDGARLQQWMHADTATHLWLSRIEHAILEQSSPTFRFILPE